MSETSTTAMLVSTRERFAAQSDAVTTTVPRDEIEAALTSEPPAELILEILRTGQGISDDEKHTVHVAWSRTDLETLLDDPNAGAITFFFDPTELERVLDESEVEGHGLREAAVVVSIAAAAAAGASSAALAEPGGAVGSPVQVAVGGHDEATLAARGIEPGTVAVSHDEATLAARGIEPGTVAVSHDEATLVARGVEPGTVAASHDEATLALAALSPGPRRWLAIPDPGSICRPSIQARSLGSLAVSRVRGCSSRQPRSRFAGASRVTRRSAQRGRSRRPAPLRLQIKSGAGAISGEFGWMG